MLDPDTRISEAVASNITVAGVLDALQRARVGSNYRWLTKQVRRLGLDTSHWKGRAHGQAPRPSKVDWGGVLVENSPYPLNSRRKKRLIKDGLLVEQCSVCGSPPSWQGRPLTLVLDHINGVRNDHRLGNLRLVCPNCDSQLSTFCGRNKVVRR